MWNDKVEATPATKPSWMVPTFFVVLAVCGFLVGVCYGQLL